MATTIRQRVPAAPDTFDAARAQIDRIADRLHLDAATRDLLRSPSREFRFTIRIRMDDGSTRVFRAVRVQHNDARGPFKGGVRDLSASGQGFGKVAQHAARRFTALGGKVAAVSSWNQADARRCDRQLLRTGARERELVAVDRVAKACRARGWV
jgi:glutamate dehydrogenase/leucine dehydrogenase